MQKIFSFTFIKITNPLHVNWDTSCEFHIHLQISYFHVICNVLQWEFFSSEKFHKYTEHRFITFPCLGSQSRSVTGVLYGRHFEGPLRLIFQVTDRYLHSAKHILLITFHKIDYSIFSSLFPGLLLLNQTRLHYGDTNTTISYINPRQQPYCLLVTIA